MEEQSEDGDLGLGYGCQPGGLPPFEILHRPRSSNGQPRPSDRSAFHDSDVIQSVRRPTNPLTKLTSKLGFYSKPGCVSQADDNTQERPESDTVAVGTSLKHEKLMFHRDMMTKQHRRSVQHRQLGTSGVLVIVTIQWTCFCRRKSWHYSRQSDVVIVIFVLLLFDCLP